MENHLQQQSKSDSCSEDVFLYGTLQSWSQVLAVSRRKLTKFLRNIEYLLGKDSMGKVCQFYEENEVRRAVGEILTIPKASDEGFLFFEGKKYGTLKYLGKVLKISPTLLKKHSSNLESIRACTIKGHEHVLYSEDDVRQKYADYLNTPSADGDGFLEMDGTIYGLINSWAKKFDINQKTMQNRLENEEFIKVKDRFGRLSKAYSQHHASLIAEARNLPMEDRKGGMLVIEGVQYATTRTWASHYGISYDILLRRLKWKKSVLARVSSGNRAPFYPQSIIEQYCSDLIHLTTENERK
jgi:hypothetical protein